MKQPRVSVTQMSDALRAIKRPGGSQLQFLQAHYSAPGHAMTAAKLAEAACYRSWAGLNLQYGLLAKKIGRALGANDYDLGALIEFAAPRSLTNNHWVLIMRPEFARALKRVGWVREE